MSRSPSLQPLIVSAPFGNYVQPTGTTPTLGTFTAARRPGRVWRVLRTVRYYRRLGAWVNRIGLRNPGIEWLAERVRSGRVDVSNKIISVHGFEADDWWMLLDRVAELRPLAVELNISCPNVGELTWPPELFERAVGTGLAVIVKLPPVNYRPIFEAAHGTGVRGFHCCNTLPIPAGGLSGEPLKPLALQCIRGLLGGLTDEQRAELTVIGGGGIREPGDIDDYAEAGATHVAVGTKVMNPVYLLTHRPLRPLVERAESRLTGRYDVGRDAEAAHD